MQKTNPRTKKRPKRLHFVWFVDASQTKSSSVSLRALAFACVGAAALVAAGAASMFLYARQTAAVHEGADYVRELKTGLLAQAMVYERTLGDKDIGQGEGSLAERTRQVEKEIGRNAKAAIVAEPGKGREAADLGKVSGSLTNLDNATLNLVAAGAVEDLAVAGSVPVPPGSLPAQREAGTPSVAGSNAPSQFPGKVAGLAAKAPLDPKPFLGAMDDRSSKALGIPTPTKVGFENITAEDSDDEGVGTDLRFRLVNAHPARLLSGRVCAIARVRDSNGNETQETVPPGLKTTGSTPAHDMGCDGGQSVRFARFRPTGLQFKAEPSRIVSISLFFTESATRAVQSRAWTNPNAGVTSDSTE